MRILILSCNTGQGHNAAGMALHEEFLAQGADCELLDALSLSGKGVSNVVSGAYVSTVTRAPWLFGGLYRVGGLISSDRRKSPIYWANQAYARALGEYIARNQVDGVVMPHLFPAEALTHLRRKGVLAARCYSVATDYTCIPFWEETEMDGYFVPHADLLPEYVERGLPAERLLPLGIPASSRFAQPLEPDQARAQLGLPLGVPVFLVMTGSMGYGGAAEIASLLAERVESAQVLVLAGRNQPLKAEVEGLSHPRIRALSFTDQVPVYMRAADVVLTKPGGLSSTEAAVCNVPLVLTAPIPGCEQKNAAFFASHGMALCASDGASAAAKAVELARDAAACQAMRMAQRHTINPHAARDCVATILSELETARNATPHADA